MDRNRQYGCKVDIRQNSVLLPVLLFTLGLKMLAEKAFLGMGNSGSMAEHIIVSGARVP